MLKIKTTFVLCCSHVDCGYGVGGNTVEVQGLLELHPEIEVDYVPGSAKTCTPKFLTPEGWGTNYNRSEFRCPEHKAHEA